MGESVQRLLIVAATGMEVRGVVDEQRAQAELAAGRWFHEPISERVGVTVSGIGRANAAGATAWTLGRGQYSTVVNVGICGALPDGGCDVGDVVIANESVFAEEGIALCDGDHDMSGLGFDLYPEPDGRWNAMINDAPLVTKMRQIFGPRVRVGGIGTVARCSGTDAAAAQVRRQTGCVVEAMEGAAVVLAARRMGIRAVAEVRVVSNTCGERAAQVWALDKALATLDDVVERIVGGF